MSSGRYSVKIQAGFESAHYLWTYRGIQEPLHGHSYRIEAVIAGPGGGLDSDALAIDFVASRDALMELARQFDYKCINEVPPFDSINPSAENLARWFHEQLSTRLGASGTVLSTTIWEGPVNSATYEVTE